MYKLYNTQSDISTNFSHFLISAIPNIRKTQLNIIPSILFGMIISESVSSFDIAKSLKDQFADIQIASVIKRINRFFSNSLFNPYQFYNQIISYVIRNFKSSHKDNRVHIIFDHMFSHDNYTVFLISMRIGKQGIPLYFKCFKGIHNSDAFNIDTLKDGISHVSKLFENTNFKLIFLADRWFNSTSLMKHIASLGHTFCIRLKNNHYVYYYDKKEKRNIRKKLKELVRSKATPTYFNNILFTNEKYQTNIVISDAKDADEPWIIITNGDCRRAIKDYSYRFGGIETIFKNQKSNGFNLEKICSNSLKSFTNKYCLVCVLVLYLTTLGTDYSKNSDCYKKVKIPTHTFYIINTKKIKKRIMSLFNTGLTLFKLAFNSHKYIRLPFSFKLYDV